MLRISLIALATLSVAACSTGPRPMYGMPTSTVVVDMDDVEYVSPPVVYGNQYGQYNGQSVGPPVRDRYTGNCTRSVAGGYGYIGC
ncbi:MAG: hypothetical protein V4474_03590 [Patescibacteria group bacterium]